MRYDYLVNHNYDEKLTLSEYSEMDVLKKYLEMYFSVFEWNGEGSNGDITIFGDTNRSLYFERDYLWSEDDAGRIVHTNYNFDDLCSDDAKMQRNSIFDKVRTSLRNVFKRKESLTMLNEHLFFDFYDYSNHFSLKDIQESIIHLIIDHYVLNNSSMPAEYGFSEFLDSGIYDIISFKNLCIVCRPPIEIIKNEKGQLHSDKGAAVTMADGYKLCCLYNRWFPECDWRKIVNHDITKMDFIQEKNMEVRAAMYNYLGEKKIIDLLGAKVVDTQLICHKNGDLEEVTLLKTKEVFEELNESPLAWVKMQCPSTGRIYLQGVEPQHNNALEAISSLSRFAPEDYSFDYRS
jgi:hypothetical protein